MHQNLFIVKEPLDGRALVAVRLSVGRYHAILTLLLGWSPLDEFTEVDRCGAVQNRFLRVGGQPINKRTLFADMGWRQGAVISPNLLFLRLNKLFLRKRARARGRR